jgi:hypothetical protein
MTCLVKAAEESAIWATDLFHLTRVVVENYPRNRETPQSVCAHVRRIEGAAPLAISGRPRIQLSKCRAGSVPPVSQTRQFWHFGRELIVCIGHVRSCPPDRSHLFYQKQSRTQLTQTVPLLGGVLIEKLAEYVLPRCPLCPLIQTDTLTSLIGSSVPGAVLRPCRFTTPAWPLHFSTADKGNRFPFNPLLLTSSKPRASKCKASLSAFRVSAET